MGRGTPGASVTSMVAPARRRMATSRGCSNSAARCSGVSPMLLGASTFVADRNRSRWTHLPLLAASCSIPLPLRSPPPPPPLPRRRLASRIPTSGRSTGGPDASVSTAVVYIQGAPIKKRSHRKQESPALASMARMICPQA